MPTISSLIAARKKGSAESLQALAIALAEVVRDTPEPPADPAALWAAVEDQGAEVTGTWQEVRAARDHGDLTEAEYDYLAAAVDALTQEAQDD